MCVCVCVQEEVCHRAMVSKGLEQLMFLLGPGRAFLGRRQVNLIAEIRPQNHDEFLTMALPALAASKRGIYGASVIETLRQASF